MTWYIALAKNGRTMKAVDDIADLGFCTVCPIAKEYSRDHRGRRHTKERAALGRYILVNAEERSLAAITACWNVDAMLKDDKGPVTVPAHEVDAVIELDGSGILDRTSAAGREFSKDDKVRIVKGIFEGIIGKLIKHRGNRKWQVELTNAYGRGAGKMLASEDEIEPVEEKAA